jgi:hypothetical protein
MADTLCIAVFPAEEDGVTLGTVRVRGCEEMYLSVIHTARVFLLCIISACRCLDTRVGGILGRVRPTGIRFKYRL